MAYDHFEDSAYDGAPVEYYEFSWATQRVRYTSAEADDNFQGHNWASIPISRESNVETSELAKAGIRITGPRTMTVANLFRVHPPGLVVGVKVFRAHRDTGDFEIRWMGRVLNVEFKGPSAELYCEPVTTSVKRIGLRRQYGRACPHVLYDTTPKTCNVVKANFAVVATVTAVSGQRISLAGGSPKLAEISYFLGGEIEWYPVGTPWQERSAILGHPQANLIQVRTGDGMLNNGDTVVLYPGCRHTVSDCHFRFNNFINYGGQPFFPLDNPFKFKTMF